MLHQHINRINLKIAELFLENKSYTEAIDWFEKLPANFFDNQYISQEYSNALFFARSYDKAYIFVRKFYTNKVYYPQLLEIQAWLCEYKGDLDEAVKVQKCIIECKPNNKNHIEYARLLYKTENFESTKSVLEQISPNIEDPFELIQIAELYNLLGNYDKAIYFGYKALKKGRNNAEIQASYFFLFIRLEPYLDLKIELVQNNSAIYISDDTEKRWVIISDYDPIMDELNEYSMDDPISKKMVGMKIGDTFEFTNSINTKIYKILEIQSIYVRRFQESIKEFGFRFPENKEIITFSIKDEDYSEILRLVARTDSHNEQIHEYYSKGLLTVEQFSQLIGRNQLLTLLTLQQNTLELIIASQGSFEEQRMQIQNASSSSSITLTFSSVLTLKSLDLLSKISSRYKKIYISQKMIDQIKSTILELDFEKIYGKKSISYSEGSFRFNEYPVSSTIETISFFEELLIYFQDNCEIVSINPDNFNLLDNNSVANRVLGEINIFQILIAKQTQTSILCDELM